MEHLVTVREFHKIILSLYTLSKHFLQQTVSQIAINAKRFVNFQFQRFGSTFCLSCLTGCNNRIIKGDSNTFYSKYHGIKSASKNCRGWVIYLKRFSPALRVADQLRQNRFDTKSHISHRDLPKWNH